ncbi:MULTISPECIES: phosphotransferase [Paenibacillus]|uniref:phosphotransferase n=1 Tax=Paenibacillus TaxID=44249 RepID=UPI0019164D92|nr:phosphotransferase [Paenibacillus sp. EPM92]
MESSQPSKPFDDALLEFVCERFQLGRFIRFDGMLGGSFNVNMKMTTSDGTFAVRVLNRSAAPEHLGHARQAIALLRANGIPAACPLTAVGGDPFIRYKEKLVQVTPFVSADSFQCREAQVFESARMLRAFHESLVQVPAGPRPSWSFYADAAYYTEALERMRSLSGIPADERAEAEKLTRRVLDQWGDAASGLPCTTLHGDWHFWNQCYAEDRVCLVMDFDFMQQGQRVQDIAYALWVINLLLPEHADTFDRCFLRGYGKLTEEEAAIMPIAAARVSLFFLCHAANASSPAQSWRKHYRKQLPFIRSMLAEGGQRVVRLAQESQL